MVETYCSRVPRKIEKQIREWVRFQFTEDQNEVKVCLFHLVLWAFSASESLTYCIYGQRTLDEAYLSLCTEKNGPFR